MRGGFIPISDISRKKFFKLFFYYILGTSCKVLAYKSFLYRISNPKTQIIGKTMHKMKVLKLKLDISIIFKFKYLLF